MLMSRRIGLLDASLDGVSPAHPNHQFLSVATTQELFKMIETRNCDAVGIGLIKNGLKNIEIANNLLETFPGLIIYLRVSPDIKVETSDIKRQLTNIPCFVFNNSWESLFPNELNYDASKEIIGTIKDSSQIQEIPFVQLRPGGVTPFTLYVKINETNFIPLKKAGDEIDVAFIDQYAAKNLKSLYYSNQDRFRLRNEFNLLAPLLTKIQTNEELKHGKKSSRDLIEDIYNWGIDEIKVQKAIEICHTIERHITINKNIVKVLGQIIEKDRDFYTDSFLSATITALIYNEITNTSQNETHGAVLAAMLQYIGLSKLPDSIGKRPFESLKKEELKLYRTYPSLSAKMILDAGVSNWITLSAVEQSQEHYDGTGFPKGLKAEQISRPARVIFLTNRYLSFIAGSDVSPYQGLVKFHEKESKEICPKCWGSLSALFNHETSAEKSETV